MSLRILIAGLIFGAAALADETGAELFQKAVTAERAAGNLEEAIKLYQRVAREFASDRALAAKALVQEARCYEKLGQSKAVKIYEQVARDYRDQREPSATASARLAALSHGDRAAAHATMTQRRIELPFPNTSLFDSNQTDGQREIYKDAATGALLISDLAGRDKRVIFKPKPGEQVPAYLPSRDLSMVAMLLVRQDGSRKGAVVKTDGTGYRELDISSVSTLCTVDWSWDNRYLFTCGTQPDGTLQLLRVSAADGEIRKLRATDNIFHRPSPDGRFIASAPNMLVGKVFVAPSQDGEPQLVADSARLIDWTRDGRYLVIASARFGSEALYLLPIKEGRVAGDPVFVRYGPCTLGSTNADGALVYRSTLPGGEYAVWLGKLDSGGRLADWKRLSLGGTNRGSIVARWSPDSSQIAYTTADEPATQNTRVVHLNNVATGEDRELYRDTNFTRCVWAAQRPSLFCIKSVPPYKAVEVFSISIDSGRVEQLGSVTSAGNLFFASPDDRALYLLLGPDRELIRWEISTQQATTLGRTPGFGSGNGGGSTPNPDERWMARRDKAIIEIRPTPGGDWKPLISVDPTQMGFSGDGNWLLYHDVDAAGKHSLFRAPTSGGQPERIGAFPSVNREGSLKISPDGRKIIAEAPATPEVWVLENFEPKQR